MLALPLVKTDVLRLADWLELISLTAEGREASAGDLEEALRREDVPADAIEELRVQVFQELDARAEAAQAGYPFVLVGPLLRAEQTPSGPYIFCLCLSYWTWAQEEGVQIDVFPRRLFEQLSSAVAAAYVGGEGLRFGAPRDQLELPAEFLEAIDQVCQRLGEGQGTRQTRALRHQDDSLDVVAWRDFPDRQLGKLVLFGQCASGSNWKSKLTDLQPRDFCNYWMVSKPSSPLLKAFFTPHRVPTVEWEYANTYGGIMFDRCRIAHWATSATLDNLAEFESWTSDVLAEKAA